MQPGCTALQPGCTALQPACLRTAWVHRVAGGERRRLTCIHEEAFEPARVCSHGTAHALCAAVAKSLALRKTVPLCEASCSSRAT